MQIAGMELGYENGGGDVGFLIAADVAVVGGRVFVELGGC